MCDVLVATGVMFHRALDIALPGLPPLEFERYYSTDARESGAMGRGWRHNWETSASLSTEAVHIREGFSPPRAYPIAQCNGDLGPLIVRERGAPTLELVFPAGPRMAFLRDPGQEQRWNLLRRIDERGRWAQCGYERGQLVSIDDDEGRRIRIDYEGPWIRRVVAERHGAVLSVEYEHDAKGRLVRITDDHGSVTRFDYQDDLVIRHTPPSGVSRYLCYDEQRRCVLNWYDGGLRVRHLRFAPDGRSVLVRDSYGHGDVYRIGVNGLPEELIDHLGRRTQWVFASDGGLLCKILPDGLPLEVSVWDPETRQRATTDARGSRAVYSFDVQDRLARVENALGQALEFQRNEFGETAEVRGPGGARWRFDYDGRGSLVRAEYPDGYWIGRSEQVGTVSTWDAAGWLVEFHFDGAGNLLADVDALGRATRYEYAGQDRPVRMIRPDGSTIEWEYDSAGNIASVTDGIGRRTRYTYGPFGALAGIKYPDSRAVMFELDAEDNLRAIRNGAGETTRYEYDAAFRRRRTVYFDGRTDARVYDDRNRVTEYVDGRGERATLAYDAGDNLVRVGYADGSVQILEWDALGRLIATRWEPAAGASANPKEASFAYDPHHHVVEETHDDWRVEYQHDVGGRHVLTRDALGREIRRALGPRGLVEGLDDGGRVHRFAYSPVGELLETVLPGGMTFRYEFDRCSRLVRRQVHAPSGALVAWREFRYDAADQLIASNDWHLGERRYEYDAAGRLRRVLTGQGTPLESFAHDLEGNLLSADRARLDYAPGNRVCGASGATYEYDGAGVRVAWDGPEGRWLADCGLLNQITALRRDAAPIAEYEYDLCGRRMAKRTAGRQTRYYHHVNLLASMIVDGQERWDFLHVPGTFTPLAQVGPDGAFFYSVDQIGTPTEVWSEQGDLVAVIGARAYGADRTIAWSGSARIPVPFHFPGQVVDDESGLHYNRFRYYDPRTASFLSPDPMGVQAGLNLYASPANPMTWIDPLGLQVSILVSCVPASGPPFTPCEQKALQEKMKQMNDQLQKRPGKKHCTKCRSNKHVDYFKKKCEGSVPSGWNVDHVRELQVGGADLCCSNLMAIPPRPNMSSGGQIRSILDGLGPDAVIFGAGLMPGCPDAHQCTEPAVSRGKKSEPCESSEPVKERPC